MAGNDGAASVRACALRVARLASDGTTPAGSSNMYVTNQIVKLTMTPVREDGDDIVIKNGCGGIITAFKDAPRLKRFDASVEIGSGDVELYEMLTGGSLITVGGQSYGFAEQAIASNPPPGVSIEFWTQAMIGNGQVNPNAYFNDGVSLTTTTYVSASAAFVSSDVGKTISGTNIPAATTIASVTNATTIVLSAAGTAAGSGLPFVIANRVPSYWKWVLPKVILLPEAAAAESAAMQHVLTGPCYENPGWGNGPNNDWPTGAVSGRVRARVRDFSLPTQQIGYVATPAQV